MMAKHILARRSAAFNPDWVILAYTAGYRNDIFECYIVLVCIGQSWGWMCTWHVKSFTLFGSRPVTVFSFHSLTKSSYEMMNSFGQIFVVLKFSLSEIAWKGEI
jgi:hypothetical protein